MFFDGSSSWAIAMAVEPQNMEGPFVNELDSGVPAACQSGLLLCFRRGKKNMEKPIGLPLLSYTKTHFFCTQLVSNKRSPWHHVWFSFAAGKKKKKKKKKQRLARKRERFGTKFCNRYLTKYHSCCNKSCRPPPPGPENLLVWGERLPPLADSEAAVRGVLVGLQHNNESGCRGQCRHGPENEVTEVMLGAMPLAFLDGRTVVSSSVGTLTGYWNFRHC
jgi:hypothetical protein